MPKKFFNQNRRINTLHSETEWIIPFGYHSEDYSYIFDFEIKELWLAKWQEITKDKRVKINQNTAFLLVG